MENWFHELLIAPLKKRHLFFSFYGDSWRGWRREKKYQQLHRQQQQQEQAEDATPILT
jgi:hypothetical protein